LKASCSPETCIAIHEDRMTDKIFLSCAAEDQAHAVRLCAALEEAGMYCWLAPRDADADTNRLEAIIKAIFSSTSAVLAFTQAANASAQVCREIQLAGDTQLRICVARFEDAAPAGTLAHLLGNARIFDVIGAQSDAGLSGLLRYLQAPKV
jgi:hypothetical protein